MLTQKLNQLKEKSGLTIQEIADQSGIAPYTVQRIFNGETKNPSFNDVAEIVMTLGGSVDAILGIEHPQDKLSDEVRGLYERSLARKNKYINMLTIVLILVLAICLLFIIYDMVHEDIGYFITRS